VSHLAALVRGTVSPTALWAALLAWLAARREDVTRRVKSSPATATDPAAESPSEARRTIRSAWTEFLGYVSLRRHRTKTPGEVARHAVARDDLPAKPVRVLRDAFREVEYGARSATDRLDRVEEALSSIERSQSDEESETGDPETRGQH
jgi:hypothetical protein